MSTLLLPLLLAVGVPLDAGAATYTPPASSRAAVSLSGSWKFLKSDAAGCEVPGFDDSAWATVAVPHTWNNIDGQDGPNVGGDPYGRNYYRGVGSYRRHISVPAAYAGRKLFLQFDGANIVTDVWVNGIHVGHHEGGFAIFRFDVTAFVNTAAGNDNLITVKVDNSNSVGIAPLSADFTFFGGLYRDVSLLATDPLSAEMLDYGSPGVYLSQISVNQASANVQIKTLVNNGTSANAAATVKSVIVDANANIVQTVTTPFTLAGNSGTTIFQDVTIASPHLWDGVNDPYLYSVYVEIHEGSDTGPVRDLVPAQPLGLRYFSLDPNQGFQLNGHYLDLHGVNRHQDRLNKGWAISQSDHDQDMSLIKDIGANAVRLAHYQHAQYFYGLADQGGLVVWAELPVVNSVGGQAFSMNAWQQLTELIRQNYNHPAIIFWSVANEVLLNAGPDPNPLLTELNALAKQEDPYRITTLAHCCASDADPTTTKTDTVGYNEYYGWYYGSYNSFGSWADGTHNANPTRAFAVSEYGAGASIFLHAQNPPQSLTNHTEEYQALFHEAYWLAMKTRPFLWGKFVWNMFDFASDGRAEGDTDGRNDKGLVTYDRGTRKDAFYWYKANWTASPMVYITSRRWTQRTMATTEIKIYSNADSVELIVNGISLGSSAATGSRDRIFRWTNVALSNGANTVQAIGRTAAATVTDTVGWNLGTPKVTISSPVTGDTFTWPGNITITATPSDNSLTKVEFFADAIKLGEDTNGSDGWSLPWINVPTGSHVLTAKSTDNLGATTISPEVRITVDSSTNKPPTINLTSPADGTSFPAGSNITVVANASDSDGTVQKVTFYQGTTELFEDSDGADGWLVVLSNVPNGEYRMTGKAMDNLGATTTSNPITITVGPSSSQPPTIVTPASATPGTVTGTSTVLGVLGADDGGEPSLIYTWAATGTPPAPVSFSVNGTNLAKNITVSFVKAGNYNFQVTVQDVGGRSATSSVAVSVSQTLTAIGVSPSSAIVPAGGTQQFTAVLTDQFTNAISPQPGFSWAVSGGGTIGSTGLFTAGSAPGGSFIVSASAAGRSGSASVFVTANAGFSAKINFQLANAPTVPGYGVDGGAPFGDRGNGLIYGWSQDNAVMARDRNNAMSPDQRYDTLVHMGGLIWEIAVPNGTYNVHAVVGDPTYLDLISKLTIEGVLAIDGVTSAANAWLQGTVTVTVNDGRLTIGNQAGSYNKICFVEIASAIAVNQPPAISIGSPSNGAAFTTPATITIVANATDTDGSVAKVEFFDGAIKLGEDTDGSNGWSLVWSNVPLGGHSLTARATDNAAATTTSAPAVITVAAGVNHPPTIALSAPANGATFTTPATITMTASAADSDGSVAKVEFFDAATKLGEDTDGSDGWSLVWSNVPAGGHSLTARATDNAAATTTSAPAVITVATSVNRPPTIFLSSPVNGATFTTLASITMTANAADTDGSVVKVEFFDGATKLGEDTDGSDGWSLVWSNVPVGSHSLTGRATDNVTAVTTSSPVAITVSPSVRRFDVGSNVAFTDSAGGLWKPDQYGTGGTVSYKSNTIGNTVDGDLYRTYRFGTFNYDIPVVNGSYDVYLEFIEPWWSEPGQRIFSVGAEGSTRLANIDLYATAGKFTALEKTFRVTVTDGVLNLSFTSSVDNAIVSAIALVQTP